MVGRRSLVAESVEPRRFRLGQRVTHAVHGYRGVVCGCAPVFFFFFWKVMPYSRQRKAAKQVM